MIGGRGALKLAASVLALGLVGVAGGAGLEEFVSAQQKPESILPPGFDDPAPPPPRPTPAPSPAQGTTPQPPRPAQGGTVFVPGVPAPAADTADSASAAPLPSITRAQLPRLPSLDELESMSTEELDQLLGLKPKSDIPNGARRALTRVGVLATDEGGLPPAALFNQPEALVRATLAGTKGPVVSRWGHILLRRVLASRLAAPLGMDPIEFAALRVRVLNGMGEYALARAVVQDIDTANWSPELTAEGLTAYFASGDITGGCPAVRLQGSARKDGEWQMLQAICNAYAGETALAASQLDRALGRGAAPRIDVLLARRFAGAAGRGQRAVEIEWEGVEELNPWRFALANALGEPVPDALLDGALKAQGGAYYDRSGALLPMLPAVQRTRFAGRAAREGILSSDAMVDLYSEVYSDAGVDRGHMVRREDPNWGDDEATVRRANFDTFHLTNCSPQHGRFNRNIATWQGLENYLLENTRTLGFRACVFTGPVLGDDVDRIDELNLFLPREYWKLVVMPVQGEDGAIRPHATAYLLSQGQLIQKLLQDRGSIEAVEGFVFGEYKTFQIPIITLERETGLNFGPLRDFDPLRPGVDEASTTEYIILRALSAINMGG